ncbi:PLP-dependent aminotransferase family protein [bacterium]|nr:PLP-dependent aminotransferase family protein [bacterium]
MLSRLELLFSINVTGLKKSVIRELLKLTQDPETISFAGGLPSPETFPVQQAADLAKEVILKDGVWALQYGATEGDPRLKEQIVRLMRDDGVQVKPENILIISAAQQGLDMVGKVFVNRHNPIVIGRPSYVGAIGAFRSYAANFVGVDLDEHGLRTDLLKETLKKMRLEANLPKFIYTVPDFQNPAGVTMSLERRKTLLDLVREYQILVIEDTPYRHLRYVGNSIPTLYQLDNNEGYVISVHTFSKILFPGIRLGWIMASPQILEKFIIAKQSMDLCTSALSQAIAYEYCERGWLKPHIQENVELYQKKRKIMLEALDMYMPKQPDICWTRPEGGLFLWLTLPASIDADTMFFQALEEKVAYVAGSGFYTDGGGRHCMRINFSYPSENEIVEGIKRLSRVIRKNLDN